MCNKLILDFFSFMKDLLKFSSHKLRTKHYLQSGRSANLSAASADDSVDTFLKSKSGYLQAAL